MIWDPLEVGTSGDFVVGYARDLDGPSHFLACKAPIVATLIKRRHLELLAYFLVSVPYWSGMNHWMSYREWKKGGNILRANCSAMLVYVYARV